MNTLLYVSLLFSVLSFSGSFVNSDDYDAESELKRIAFELEQLAEKNHDEEENRSKVIKKLGSIKSIVGKVEMNHGSVKKLGKVFKTIFEDEEVKKSLRKPQNEENMKQTIELIKKKLDDRPELKEEVKSVFKQESEGNKFLEKLGKFGKFIVRAGQWIMKIIKKIFKISMFMTKLLINLTIRLVGEVVGITLILPTVVLFIMSGGSVTVAESICFCRELIGHSLNIEHGPFSKGGSVHLLQFDLGVVHKPAEY